MQIDDHIRYCPVIRESAGEEPYPQPSVVFPAAPSGTVSVEIYDFSVQPPVRLTTTALSGAELTSPSLTGLADNYTIDMGHANVVAVLDCYASEGLEAVVMFQDSGVAASRFVKVTCNDSDHIAALYPEQAVYTVANSGNTGTAFPVGSSYYPAEDLGDACTILTARGSMILDCAGSWNGGGSGSGGCREADIGTHLSSVGALVRTRTTASWYPHQSGEVIDLVDCTVVSVNVPYGFALGNFTNGTYFAGAPKLVNCRLQTAYFTGNGASRSGSADLTSCKVDGDVYLSSNQSPGCWAFDAVNCINGTPATLDCSSMGGGTAVWNGCAGDWTVANMASGKGASMTGIQGMPDITLASSSNSNLTVTATGAYNRVVNSTGGALTSLTERKLAGYADLTGNVVNLDADAVDGTSIADGAISIAKAPNLDAAVSSRATQAQAQAGADAAIAAREPIDANLVEVNGTPQAIADFRADVSALATAVALATVDGVADATLVAASSLIARLTAARAGYLDNLSVGAVAQESSLFDPATDQVTVGTNNDKADYAMAGTIQSLDALDTAQDAQHASTRALGGAGPWTAGTGGGSTLGPQAIFKAPILERPSPSGTAAYRVVVEFRDAGLIADPDANAVAVTVANVAGTDRSANLGAATMTRIRTGQYAVDYLVAFDAAVEQLVFTLVADFSAVTETFTDVANVLDTSNTQPSLVMSGV